MSRTGPRQDLEASSTPAPPRRRSVFTNQDTDLLAESDLDFAIASFGIYIIHGRLLMLN